MECDRFPLRKFTRLWVVGTPFRNVSHFLSGIEKVQISYEGHPLNIVGGEFLWFEYQIMGVMGGGTLYLSLSQPFTFCWQTFGVTEITRYTTQIVLHETSWTSWEVELFTQSEGLYTLTDFPPPLYFIWWTCRIPMIVGGRRCLFYFMPTPCDDVIDLLQGRVVY